MHSVFILAALISILLGISESLRHVKLTWTDCGRVSDDVRVTSIDFNPPNPLEGQTSRISIRGTVKNPFFKESTSTSSVYIDGKLQVSKTVKICEMKPALFPRECPPTRPGPFYVWYNLAIPDVTGISGIYKYEWRGNHGSRRLFCYSITLEIPPQDQFQ